MDKNEKEINVIDQEIKNLKSDNEKLNGLIEDSDSAINDWNKEIGSLRLYLKELEEKKNIIDELKRKKIFLAYTFIFITLGTFCANGIISSLFKLPVFESMMIAGGLTLFGSIPLTIYGLSKELKETKKMQKIKHNTNYQELCKEIKKTSDSIIDFDTAVRNTEINEEHVLNDIIENNGKINVLKGKKETLAKERNLAMEKVVEGLLTPSDKDIHLDHEIALIRTRSKR